METVESARTVADFNFSADGSRYHDVESASLTDTILMGCEENGRTYHSYRAGSYPFPNDDRELHRLKLQYDLISHMMKSTHFAPFGPENPPKYVLDIATGDGQWAIDFADQFPEAKKVIGTDLSAVQPNEVPANVEFYVEDSTDEWDYDIDFCFIHTRVTYGCWTNMQTEIIGQAFANLRPGGWLECQEIGGQLQCDDGTMPADWPLNVKFQQLDTVATKLMKKQLEIAPNLVEWFKEAGFVDVQFKRLKLYMSGWDTLEDPDEREIGEDWQHITGIGLSGGAYALQHRYMSMKQEEIEIDLMAARKALFCDRHVHAYQPFWVVWGRKPFAHELKPKP